MESEKPFVHACTVEPILNPFILKKININKYAPTYYKIYLLKMIFPFFMDPKLQEQKPIEKKWKKKINYLFIMYTL